MTWNTYFIIAFVFWVYLMLREAPRENAHPSLKDIFAMLLAILITAAIWPIVIIQVVKHMTTNIIKQLLKGEKTNE